MKIVTGLSTTLIALLAACDHGQQLTENSEQAQGPPGLFSVPPGDGGPETIDDAVTPCGNPKTVDLFAGQNIDVGSVTIYNDGTNLYITVYSVDGYADMPEQIKIWVGGDLTNMPATEGGAPIIGQFPYKLTTNGGTTYTVTIPLDEISLFNECGDLIYVVVHADVLVDGNGTTAETAFGGDEEGPGARWWYYSEYTSQCCNGPALDYCETAFAKGGWVFAKHDRANPEALPSLELTRMRWGWAINIADFTTHTYEIWAGAGLNKTANGTLVGDLTVTRSGSDVTVTYAMDGGYAMQEVHIYASDVAPSTIAPGKYGHTEYYDPLDDTYQETFTIDGGGGIWIIAHAVVCW